MPPAVVWTHRAERRLHSALLRAGVADASSPARTADIDARLAVAFHDAGRLVVLDLYLGYRVRPGQFILLVDVGEPQPRTFIVKLADEERLRSECDAWMECRPPAFSVDRVFMTQEPRCQPEAPHHLVALVYQDAGAYIDTERQMPLEEAFLSAVRFGSVDPASVAGVLGELFDRLGGILYHGASARDPAGKAVELNWDRDTGKRRSLADSFAAWESRPSAVEVQRLVNAVLPRDPLRFIDPVDFFRYVLAELEAGTPAQRWLPRMLRGPAHGDLHGRNVLVGVQKDEDGVVWPALFDYEHMAIDNLVGWDFVKLETELKIRAYPHVFKDQEPRRQYVVAVQALEQELGERTEQHRDDGGWPTPGGAMPCDRLRNLLLTLRRLAGRHLGATRPGDWMEEYHFLLACYAVHAVRFENQSLQERLATFVSGGVAAARFLYGRRRSQM